MSVHLLVEHRPQLPEHRRVRRSGLRPLQERERDQLHREELHGVVEEDDEYPTCRQVGRRADGGPVVGRTVRVGVRRFRTRSAVDSVPYPPAVRDDHSGFLETFE